MKFRTGLILTLILSITAIGFALGCGQSSASNSNGTAPETSATPAAFTASAGDAVFDGVKLERSEEEWKKLLTPAQYNILREEGTDYPYKSQYHDNKVKGDYYCAACHLKLFSSAHK